MSYYVRLFLSLTKSGTIFTSSSALEKRHRNSKNSWSDCQTHTVDNWNGNCNRWILVLCFRMISNVSPATLAILDLALFLGAPGKIYFITPSFVAAKLYANTVVVIFNNRAQITSTSRSTLEHAIHSADRSRGHVMNKLSNRVDLINSKRGGTNYASDIEIQKSVSVWEDGINK